MIKTSLAVMFICLGLCSCLTTGNTTVTDREQEGQPTQQIEEMDQQPAETTEKAVEPPAPAPHCCLLYIEAKWGGVGRCARVVCVCVKNVYR